MSKVDVGSRVEGEARLRGVKFARQHFLASHPHHFKKQMVSGVVVGYVGDGKSRKWRVRWDIDQVETLHASRSLTKVASNVAAGPSSVSGPSSASASAAARVDLPQRRSAIAAASTVALAAAVDNLSSDDSSSRSGSDGSDRSDDEADSSDSDHDVDDAPNAAAAPVGFVLGGGGGVAPMDVQPAPPPQAAVEAAVAAQGSHQIAAAAGAQALPNGIVAAPPNPDPVPVVVCHGTAWYRAAEPVYHLPSQIYDVPARLKWVGIEKPDVDSRTPWDYWELMFPMGFVQDIVAATALRGGLADFDAYEFFQFIGLLFAQAVQPMPSMRDWFSEESDDQLTRVRVRELGFFLSRSRFESIVSGLRIGHYSDDDLKENPWLRVSNLVNAFNDRRKQVVVPGKFLCADEDTSRWTSTRSESQYKLGGVPSLTKIKNKPEPVSVMLKSLCCVELGIKINLEIQEGKARMALKAHAQHGAGPAWLLRLTTNWAGSNRIVCADSAFASVKSALLLRGNGLHFAGVVKTASTRFPKDYLVNYPFTAVGQHIVRLFLYATSSLRLPPFLADSGNRSRRPKAAFCGMGDP